MVALALAAAGLAGCSSSAARTIGHEVARPNIVFVLTDDLSSNLVKYMPHVLAMERNGATFTSYFVTDSLCCPSRASIFTGELPHDTGVYSNTGIDGGFRVFQRRGLDSKTFAVALAGVGYDNAMMGKYLNGYQPQFTLHGQANWIAPGWSEWDVAGDGYPEFDYTLNEDHRLVHYGSAAKDYLTTVLQQRATSFVAAASRRKRPFLLEVATFAPHSPYVPAPEDAGRFADVAAPRTAAFDRADTLDGPAWLKAYPPLSASQEATIDEDFRKRVESVQAVDRMIGALEASVAKAGKTNDTYFVFSSDNGLHMGEHRMMPGKMTAFDTDIRVPLVVVGPGIAPGRTISQLAENIDLCPTFEQMGGATVPSSVDGTSLVPLLFGRATGAWRKAVLVEHHGPDFNVADPDFPPPASGNPPSYEAMRLHDAVYVEYADGEREYYDTATDPAELRNLAGTLPPAVLARLHAELAALERCHGGAACAAAERLEP